MAPDLTEPGWLVTMEELGGWLTHFPERPDTGMLLELCPAAIVGDDPVMDSCYPYCFAVMLRER